MVTNAVDKACNRKSFQGKVVVSKQAMVTMPFGMVGIVSAAPKSGPLLPPCLVVDCYWGLHLSDVSSEENGMVWQLDVIPKSP